MAIVALALSWQGGESDLNPGYIAHVPANYGNLGSIPQWRKKNFRAPVPYSPDPRLPAYNVAAPGGWRSVSPQPQVPPSIAVANATLPIIFTPAGPSQNTATVIASNENAALAKALVG